VLFFNLHSSSHKIGAETPTIDTYSPNRFTSYPSRPERKRENSKFITNPQKLRSKVYMFNIQIKIFNYLTIIKNDKKKNYKK